MFIKRLTISILTSYNNHIGNATNDRHEDIRCRRDNGSHYENDHDSVFAHETSAAFLSLVQENDGMHAE